MRISDWFLTLMVGVVAHVFVSPFGIFGGGENGDKSRTWRNDGDTNRIPVNHSAIGIMRDASGGIVGNPDPKGYNGEKQRIVGEIPDPTFGYNRGFEMGVSEERRSFAEQLDRRGLVQSIVCRPLWEEW